jgi:D-apiose dehydrogenase
MEKGVFADFSFRLQPTPPVEHGTIVVEHDYKMKLYRGDQLAKEWRAPPTEHAWSKGNQAEVILDSVYQIQRHWVNCWEQERMDLLATSGADNVQTLRLVDAAYRSATDGGVTVRI